MHLRVAYLALAQQLQRRLERCRGRQRLQRQHWLRSTVAVHSRSKTTEWLRMAHDCRLQQRGGWVTRSRLQLPVHREFAVLERFLWKLWFSI